MASGAERVEPVDPGDDVDDVVFVDAADDVRASVHRLIPIPRLSEVRAQARIDALARRVTVEPALALRLRAAIDELVADNHLDGAEGVIAALGRAEAGVPVLLTLLREPTLAPRLRGAVALSLVQPRAPWGDEPAGFSEAYARPPVARVDSTVSLALRVTLWASARRWPSNDIESERLWSACLGAGLDVSTAVFAVMEHGDDHAKFRLVAVLMRRETLEIGLLAGVGATWRTEPNRSLRRAEIALLARHDPLFGADAVALVTDPSRPSGLRLDALSGLTRCRPTADIGRFEAWLAELSAFSVREPTLIDAEPMDDTRNGPGLTIVSVSTGDRVAAVALALDVASGGTSSYIHRVATVPVEAPGR